MEKIHVLIIEDDMELNTLLTEVLLNNGYMTTSAYTGLDGLNKVRSGKFDLVLLDLMLPYRSGDEILRELRNISSIPVIVISAKDIVQTKIDLLRLGADDYITKPFDINELLARVETALRHCSKEKSQLKEIIYKNMRLNTEKKLVYLGEEIVNLTAKEYKMLEVMLKNPQKVFSKANLFESVWEETYTYEDNIINTHISNLRNKLSKVNPDTEYIETIWGMGYKLAD